MYDQNKKALLPLKRGFFCCFLVSVTFVLCSCESFIVQETTIPLTQPVQIPTQAIDSATQQKIDQLLDQAHFAYEKGRLTTPLDDNAYYRYLRVFSLDPTNRLAEQGLTEIVEKYLEWAIDSVEQQRFRTAVDFLNKARSVDETHPNINAVEKLIQNRRSVSREIYDLAPDALNSRQNELIIRLQCIARQVDLRQARVIIIARNDPEGRWIYQQLNNATETRIRATFQAGPRPSIHLLFSVPENH